MNLMVVAIGIGEGINKGTETVISYAVNINSLRLSVSYYRFMGFFTLVVASSVVTLIYIFRDALFAVYTNEPIILGII
jgi:Na+-driven multidrug efflux pump